MAVKFVVPKIAKVLEGFGKELPLVTQLVILFSDLLTYLLYLSRFSYTLYMRLTSAVPITSAYRIAVGSLSNAYLKRSLEELSPEIERR